MLLPTWEIGENNSPLISNDSGSAFVNEPNTFTAILILKKIEY